jgi:Arc/MetJ-type ribon-helix-helix transcriptional regulator
MSTAGSISRADNRTWSRRGLGAGRSPKTARNVHGVLTRAMRDVVRWRQPQRNPHRSNGSLAPCFTPANPEGDAHWYTGWVTVQVPTRFRDTEVEAIDELVADGVADSRSEVIRLAVARLAEQHHRAKTGEAIAAAYRAQPQTADEDAWAHANAVALTEAEPW